MLRSLFSGVAGLKTHQTKMDVIGNNIANVNTYGFKGGRATYKDVFYQTVNASSDPTKNLGGGNTAQVGYGSMINSIDVLHQRAGYTPTGRSMDAFINGEGYFIARDGAGDESYSRVGILGFDAEGNLVDSNKKFICGYPIMRDENGKIKYVENVPKSGSGSNKGVEVSFGTSNGAKMNDWQIVYKKTADQPDDPFSTTTPKAKLAYPAVTSDKGTKTITVSIDPAATTFPDAATILAGISALPKGNLPDGVDFGRKVAADAPAAGGVTVTLPADLAALNKIVNDSTVDTKNPIVSIAIKDGLSQYTSEPMLDKSKGPQRIKKPGELLDPDPVTGVPTSESGKPIELKSISIGSSGIISGIDNEGRVISVGQVCLANVPNPEAMSQAGSSYFKAMNNTGEITYAVPGDGTCGALQGSGLEMSNVDLSTEFSDMIITQRGFQANSKIITVGDEMLQELVNMKR